MRLMSNVDHQRSMHGAMGCYLLVDELGPKPRVRPRVGVGRQQLRHAFTASLYLYSTAHRRRAGWPSPLRTLTPATSSSTPTQCARTPPPANVSETVSLTFTVLAGPQKSNNTCPMPPRKLAPAGCSYTMENIARMPRPSTDSRRKAANRGAAAVAFAPRLCPLDPNPSATDSLPSSFSFGSDNSPVSSRSKRANGRTRPRSSNPPGAVVHHHAESPS